MQRFSYFLYTQNKLQVKLIHALLAELTFKQDFSTTDVQDFYEQENLERILLKNFWTAFIKTY